MGKSCLPHELPKNMAVNIHLARNGCLCHFEQDWGLVIGQKNAGQYDIEYLIIPL